MGICKEIDCTRTPKVLLLGNGINRAYGFESWDGLIQSITTKTMTEEEQKAMKQLPYPMQPIVLTEDHVDKQMDAISLSLANLRVPEKEEALLRQFASLPVDAILTTNYTYELEQALDNDFRCLPKRKCAARTALYGTKGSFEERQLHTCFSVGAYPPIWHIHGEAARPNTMILGHYYYGKLLAKIQQHISPLLRRWNARSSRNSTMEPRSWVDYFMLGDVYIVGFGMDLAELDIWWLANCKKRNFPDQKIYLFKHDISTAQRLMAEAYGITVIADGYDGDYAAYYHGICDRLREEL